jgi:hypothetical protein
MDNNLLKIHSTSKPAFLPILRAKSEALAYLEARAQTYLEPRARICQNVSCTGVVTRRLTGGTARITRWFPAKDWTLLRWTALCLVPWFWMLRLGWLLFICC